MPVTFRQLLLFIRLSRPIFLLGGALLYGLGIAIARYLGRPIDLTTYLLGQATVTFIQLMTHYLNEYFNSELDRNNEARTIFTGGSDVLGADGLPRSAALYAAAFSLALVACMVLLLILNTEVPFLGWTMMILIFLGAFFYNMPPLSLMTSGFGEITTSFVVAGLLPAFAYTLQTGELHRFLIMSTTPLIALHFAMLLVFELPDYALDSKYEKRNLLVRAGWSIAMRLHDYAIVFAVISFVVAFFLGLPGRIVGGTLIAVPLAIAQIWQMDRIRQGYPVKWQTIIYGAVALFTLTTYFELIGFLMS
jgi:1,4-dihydroxy-2-naphthoate octaprenyltransferase